MSDERADLVERLSGRQAWVITAKAIDAYRLEWEPHKGRLSPEDIIGLTDAILKAHTNGEGGNA